jgi:hypothetical protein
MPAAAAMAAARCIRGDDVLRDFFSSIKRGSMLAVEKLSRV